MEKMLYLCSEFQKQLTTMFMFSIKTIYKIMIACIAMVLGGFALCGGIYLFDTELVTDNTMVLVLAIYLLADGIATFVTAAACNVILISRYAEELNEYEPEEEEDYETANY